MKKINIKFLIVALVFIFTLPACNDWLTVEPEDVLLKENFWETTDDVNSAVGAMYDAMRNVTESSLIWGELRADLVEMGSNFSEYARIAESDISASNSKIDWSGYYDVINLANTLMYFNKDVYGNDETFTKDMMDAIDAEALFIRSLNLFYLVRLWKDVPLLITPSISDTTDMLIPKSSEKEVLDQIIKDLLKAKDIAYTTEYMQEGMHPGYAYGRANKYAIMTLLADVYLWDENYRMASNYCDSVILSGMFDLEPQETWFDIYYPGNSATESIFELQYNDNIESQENPIYDNLLPFSGTAQMRPDLQNLRLLLSEEDIRTCNTSLPTMPQPLWKYYGTSVLSPISRTPNQRDANQIFYRYADVLLIKAEALNELDDLIGANYYVSMTKERAGLSHIDLSTKTDMRTEILDERAREFLVEGKRWFDVLRFAKRNNYENKQLVISMILAGADIKQQAILKSKVYDTLSYYLPIPDGDVRTNPNLEQNPYYNR